jgi:hypothetical protein
MSIVLVGSTSGSVTLQEPAIAGSTVLTLPAVSGTVLTTGSSGQSIPKAALPTGSVLQVVSFFESGTISLSSGGSVAPVTITPTSSTSKILVCASCSVERTSGSTGNYIMVYVRRAGTTLGNTSSLLSAAGYNVTGGSRQGMSVQYLDSPATTSARTYDIYQDFSAAGGASFNFYGANVTLLEIAA